MTLISVLSLEPYTRASSTRAPQIYHEETGATDITLLRSYENNVKELESKAIQAANKHMNNRDDKSLEEQDYEAYSTLAKELRNHIYILYNSLYHLSVKL
ncbi:unnamed protein product [Schistosoma rodhaini]|nr:unnamed protein product [Schistosoma rodhaini]